MTTGDDIVFRFKRCALETQSRFAFNVDNHIIASPKIYLELRGAFDYV